MISFAMVAAFLMVEVLAGIVTGSLALVSDAGHMPADVVGLGAALSPPDPISLDAAPMSPTAPRSSPRAWRS